MNKDYEFIEDEYEEGITFKKVAHFFKKGWLRAIVYVVICLLVALVVALPIRTFYRSEPVAQTTIEFVYDGIEQGLAPDGSILSTDNIITSTVLADAVDRAELGEKINNVSTLRSNMRVEAVETEEYASLVEAAANGDANAIATLRTYVMHPTSFNIVISNPAALGLTDSEAKKLLSCIVNSYYADFLKRYTVQEMFSQDVFALSSLLDDETRFFIVNLQAQIRRLTDLVEDLLLFSRDVPLESAEPVPLAPLLSDVADELAALADEKCIAVRVQETQAVVRGQDGLLERVFYNLLENAIKYSPAGTAIDVAVGTDGECTTVSFADEGCGVPEELREAIFEPFFRVDASRSHLTGGNGLGLALCKKILERHGASIRVLPHTPRGSIFQVSFPA